MTQTCPPPKVTIAGGHPEAKDNMLPGPQHASSCSAPYALGLPPASEVPLAGGRAEFEALITPACILPNVPIAGVYAEVKAHLLPGCQPATSCSSPDALRPACQGARKDPVPPACNLPQQRPPGDQGVARLRRGTSPRSPLRWGPCRGRDLRTALRQHQRLPEVQEVTYLRRGTSPRHPLHRGPS